MPGPLSQPKNDRAFWEAWVAQADPQQACEAIGLQHFPHPLASAANMLLLAQHLAGLYGPDVPVREAMVRELMKGPHPPSNSESTAYWQEIKPHLPVLENVLLAFMGKTGNLK